MLLNKEETVKATNRDNAVIGYKIPDLGNLRRIFQPGETKELTVEELRKLSWTPGGKYILEHCLVVDNEDLIEELLGEVEPEYYYTEEDVRNLLSTGSLEQLQDCLDFAPQGVLDMIKQIAIETKLNDLAKRNAISEKMNFNLNSVIAANEPEVEEEVKTETKKRRTAPVKKSTGTTKGRRTAAPKKEASEG